MTRLAARGGLTFALIALASSAVGQQPLPRVEYRDPKDGQVRSAETDIKPGPVGYQILPTGSKIPLTVYPKDIVRVIPPNSKVLDQTKLQPMFDAEKKGEFAKALTGYEELRKAAGTSEPAARQFLEFRRAVLTARVADGSEEGAWKERAGEAASLLDAYLGEYKTGWELWLVARTCARLQLELGRPEKAVDVWGRMTKKEVELPGDLRVEASLQEVDSLIRARDWGAAQGRAKDVPAAAGPAKDRLTIYQIAAKSGTSPNPLEGVKLIEDEIAKTQDRTVRATGYAMIGELYLNAKKARDAMWAYLWVEVVYNQDKDEVAKALIRLAEVFAEQGDEERAKAYREKIRRFVATL